MGARALLSRRADAVVGRGRAHAGREQARGLRGRRRAPRGGGAAQRAHPRALRLHRVPLPASFSQLSSEAPLTCPWRAACRAGESLAAAAAAAAAAAGRGSSAPAPAAGGATPELCLTPLDGTQPTAAALADARAALAALLARAPGGSALAALGGSYGARAGAPAPGAVVLGWQLARGPAVGEAGRYAVQPRRPRAGLVGRLALRRRAAAAATAMEPEPALLMANLARARRGAVLADPFAGSCGLLLAAAALLGGECVAFGSDADPALLTAAGAIAADFAAQGAAPPRLRVQRVEALAAPRGGAAARAALGAPWDGVISDPPYDMRAAVGRSVGRGATAPGARARVAPAAAELRGRSRGLARRRRARALAGRGGGAGCAVGGGGGVSARRGGRGRGRGRVRGAGAGAGGVPAPGGRRRATLPPSPPPFPVLTGQVSSLPSY